MRKETLNIQADREGIRKILSAGHAFDINKGGLYDARSGVVNIWCSPDDRPLCWEVAVTCGGLDYPRAYVGALNWDWLDDDRVVLHIEADPHDLLDRHPRRPLTDAEWADILGWLRRHALALVRLAALAPREVGTRCPLCPFVLPAGELLNDLLDHIAGQHPAVNVQGIDLSHTPVLRTDRGNLPLSPAEQFD